MQVPISWINEIVKVETIQLSSLIEKLTLGGFEVEEILEIELNNQKQIALDVSSTANRSDSLSIQGLSREIAALLNEPIKTSNYFTEFNDWKHCIESKVKPIVNDSGCSMFLTIVVENFSNTTVPKWVIQKLIKSGIVPSHNLIDFQNYVLLETGYPICVYDFKKICSELNTLNASLSISTRRDKQSFVASNHLTYELDDSILTINADKRPISIAGLIEAKDFTYSENTNTLLIEGSIFNAAKIRQQSRKLGLRTERSARYEKALKNSYLIESLYRLISLLRIYNQDLVCKLHTITQIDEKVSTPIFLKYENLNEILGPTNKLTEHRLNYIDPQSITNYLTRLNFKFIFDASDLIWKVEIPHSRTDDLIREIDLIEEIGRLHGFNNFLITLPKIKAIGVEDSISKTRKKITNCLLSLGFNELIHYSLVNETTFISNEIQLINPLLCDCSNLRTSLLPSLVKTLQENLKQKNICIEGFEYGHIFVKNKIKFFSEKEHIAGVFGGAKTKLSWSSVATELSWFEAKGKIEQLFNQLNLTTHWKSFSFDTTEKILHPYRSATLYLTNNISIGIFGQIHPILANQLTLSTEVYLFEFDLEAIKDGLQKNKLILYKQYSMYPKVLKDLSIIIQRDVTFKEIQELLYFHGSEFLCEINLLDEYRGPSIPNHQTSLCLQLVFQSNEKTLENKEIESLIQEIQTLLTNKLNAIIRT